MDEHDIAGKLAEILAEQKAVRRDIDELRSSVNDLREEVRANDRELRANIAVSLSRQNSHIEDAKKKPIGRLNSSRY